MNHRFWSRMRAMLLSLLLFPSLFAQTPEQEAIYADLVSVGTGFDIPWDLEYWGNDTLLFTQRAGQIMRLDINSGMADTLFNIPDVASLQHSGLMGMELHPQWPAIKEVFIVYAYYNATFSVLLRVEKLSYDAANDRLVSASIVKEEIPGAATTTGARMMAVDSMLYLTTGDINLGTVSQDTASLNGKILRYKLDGSIPADNPFQGSPVYSMGHRNPQGIAMAADGSIFSCEHGASANDELNKIEAGRNYGWPQVSGFCEGSIACQTLNAKEPLAVWSPPIAPGALAYADTVQVLTNSLLMTGLRGKALYAIKLNAARDTIESVDTLIIRNGLVPGRLRDVLVTPGPDSRIFVTTSNNEGQNQPNPGDDQIYEVFTGRLTSKTELSLSQAPKVFLDEDILQIRSEHAFKSSTSLKIFDFQGKLVKNQVLKPIQTHHLIPLTTLPDGIYLVRINSRDQQFSYKIYLTH
ncbi:MAG: PQQ-dependent sugar dehydrogenase [Bacteroidota bacterium]